jgi:hypothetical protein
MAIKNTDQNYLKITRIDDSDLSNDSQVLTYEIWVDEDTRNNPTEFDKPVIGNISLGQLSVELKKNANGGKTIKDNRISAAYKALKSNSKFMDWEDC